MDFKFILMPFLIMLIIIAGFNSAVSENRKSITFQNSNEVPSNLDQ